MAGVVVTVTSGKGGVGKTTTTANLGVALALRGRRVALIDGDIGLRNLDVVMGLENRVVYNIMHVVRGTVTAERSLIKDKRVPGLSLLAADQHSEKEDLSQEDMIELCAALAATHDYVIIDSPAGIEAGFRNALAPADIALLVTTPDISAVRDADRVIGLVEAAGKPPPRLILNRLRADRVAQGDMMASDDVLDILRVELLGVVPEDDGVLSATNRGEPVAMDDRSVSGQAYRNMAARLEGEPAPITALDGAAAHGFLGRLSQFLRGTGGAQ
jgi:septum site-determining protein MinD